MLHPHGRDANEDDYEALLRLDETVERKGASQDAISKLETIRLPRGGPSNNNAQQFDDCTICLEACKPGDMLRKLPCGHTYHQACIDRWLTTKAACPVCQKQIG